MGLYPDGALAPIAPEPPTHASVFGVIDTAMRARNFWLVLAGSALVIGAMNAVIQHFIFFLVTNVYSAVNASRILSVLLLASIGRRVIVGYTADRFRKKNTMTLFYALLDAAIPILFLTHQPIAALSVAVLFGSPWARTTCSFPLSPHKGQIRRADRGRPAVGQTVGHTRRRRHRRCDARLRSTAYSPGAVLVLDGGLTLPRLLRTVTRFKRLVTS
jgi:predicted MFS family arabinose efflux permease